MTEQLKFVKIYGRELKVGDNIPQQGVVAHLRAVANFKMSYRIAGEKLRRYVDQNDTLHVFRVGS